MNKSIKILGINYGGHDTSACLMIDGNLVACCEEERYNKWKKNNVKSNKIKWKPVGKWKKKKHSKRNIHS